MLSGHLLLCGVYFPGFLQFVSFCEHWGRNDAAFVKSMIAGFELGFAY